MLTRDTRADPPCWADGREHHGVAADRLPLSDPQIVGLLSRSPDYGPLADPQRRASCLSGLGYSAATAVLGARPVDMHGRPAVLMVLAADTPRTLLALVVEPDCNSAHTGLLAEHVGHSSVICPAGRGEHPGIRWCLYPCRRDTAERLA